MDPEQDAASDVIPTDTPSDALKLNSCIDSPIVPSVTLDYESTQDATASTLNGTTRQDKDDDVTSSSGGKPKTLRIGSVARKGFYARSPIAGGHNPSPSSGIVNSEKRPFYPMGKSIGTAAERKIPVHGGSPKSLDDQDEYLSNDPLSASRFKLDQEMSSPSTPLSANSAVSALAATGEIDSLVDASPTVLTPGSSVRSAMAPYKRDAPMSAFSKFGPKVWGQKANQLAEASAREASAMHYSDESDRFNLLLLEDHEYYFKDFFCTYFPAGAMDYSVIQNIAREVDNVVHKSKINGTLKLCSNCLFFVPLNLQETVFQINFESVKSIERYQRPGHIQPAATETEEHFVIQSSERTDVMSGRTHNPFSTSKGDFSFLFSPMHVSVSTLLPKILKLFDLSKYPESEKKPKLQALIKRHEEELHFNVGWFERPEEALLLEFVGYRIMPLLSQPGRIVLTKWKVYFQPFNVVSSSPVSRYKMEEVTSIVHRTSVLGEAGVEIFFAGWNSVYLMFKSPKDRNSFCEEFLKQPGLSLAAPRSLQDWQHDWVTGKVSNFDYLMFLNREANRSFSDLSQYPVFPWVIADYKSEKLDLNNPDTFRDLSKPMGCLNPERLEKFREQYSELAEAYEEYCEECLPDWPPPFAAGRPSPPYLYGCHYSTPGYVVFFKLRDNPQLMLRLQNGKFDMPDRLFFSIPQTWESAHNKSTDLKELIPEFYSMDPSFLVNSEGLDLGTKQDRGLVWDVELPPWADSPVDFMTKMRMALECPMVSQKLHKWINLIFGCKQTGAAAIESCNVFHPLTDGEYCARVLQYVDDEAVSQAVKLQMREFGRTPNRLFSMLHPPRLPEATGLVGKSTWYLKRQALVPQREQQHEEKFLSEQ